MSIKAKVNGEWVVVGGVSGDFIIPPDTAEVGQTIRVSAVDENGKPTAWEAVDMASGGQSGGDFIPVPETAEVGQTIRVSAVDANGKPTAWEAVDMASGESGGSEWTLLADVTVDQQIDLYPISITGGVVTFDTADENYSHVATGQTIPAAIAKKDFATKDVGNGCINCKLVPTDLDAGTFELKNGDNGAITNTYNVSDYKIILKSVALVSVSGITQHKRYRFRYTSPYYCSYGLRSIFACNGMSVFGWGACLASQISGGVEYIVETEPYAGSDDYINVTRQMAVGQPYGFSPNQAVRTFQIDQAKNAVAPGDGIIEFKLENGIFPKGARFQIWGSDK